LAKSRFRGGGGGIRYSETQREAGYIQQIQLDTATARYIRIQLWIRQWEWDTAGYSGSAAKWLDTVGIRTAGYQGYGEGEIQSGDP